MADDDIPDQPDHGAAQEPERPITPQDRLIRAYEKGEAEKEIRKAQILAEHGERIDHLLLGRGEDNEEIRAIAAGFVAEDIASRPYKYEQYEPRDLSDIADKSIGQAYDAQSLQNEGRNSIEIDHEPAAPSEPSPEQKQLDATQSQPSSSKEEEQEQEPVRESEAGKEIGDAKAARIAEINERGEQFEAWEKARQETLSRDGVGNER
ncbi:MAG: hypothetical protein P4L57_10240 [Rhizomicrobium sp.]|nr:hypothetical protein [Rhizomicrobium sp.]